MNGKTALILDSSALVSLASETDQNHKIAVSASYQIKKENRILVLPGEILSETINVIGRKFSHRAAVRLAEDILEGKEFLISETTSKIRATAFQKFKIQPRGASFTDCLVMAFADEFETKEIFGFDEIFAKRGYRRFGVD